MRWEGVNEFLSRKGTKPVTSIQIFTRRCCVQTDCVRVSIRTTCQKAVTNLKKKKGIGATSI